MNRIATWAILATMLWPPSPENVRQELADLQSHAHAARESGNKAQYLEDALKAALLLNDAPQAVESVARAYIEAGDRDRALDALMKFAEMGAVDDSLVDGSNKTFASVADSPRFKAVLDRFVRNKSVISTSQTAFILADPGIVAEDIDYDPEQKSFLITSILEKKIIRVSAGGASTDFAPSPSHWPMLAIKIDPARRRAWATEVALNGFTAAPKSDWGRSAVLCFDLRTGKLLERIEGPPRSALGDMVLAGNGDPIVSDGEGGGIYRASSSRLTLINGTDFISPQTPTMLPDGNHALVPDYLRGIGVLDLRTGKVVDWVKGGEGIATALNGVDGLYFEAGSLFMTQNGTSPERVARVELDPSHHRVLALKIIEQATETLGDPTHGVIVDKVFYYIANSGWNVLDDHGDVKPGARLTPARIMRFQKPMN